MQGKIDGLTKKVREHFSVRNFLLEDGNASYKWLSFNYFVGSKALQRGTKSIVNYFLEYVTTGCGNFVNA